MRQFRSFNKHWNDKANGTQDSRRMFRRIRDQVTTKLYSTTCINDVAQMSLRNVPDCHSLQARVIRFEQNSSKIKSHTSHRKPSVSLRITIHRKKLRRIEFAPIPTTALQGSQVGICMSVGMITVFSIENCTDTHFHRPGFRRLEGAGITVSVGAAAVHKPFAGNTGFCHFAAETAVQVEAPVRVALVVSLE